MAAETHSPTAGHGESGTTAEVAAHGGGEGGLPQFQFEHWGGQIVWLLLIFAVLYILLAKVFVPRLRGILDTRAQTIAEAVEQARKVQAEAEAQAKAAQAEIDAARAQSRQVAAEAKAKAAAELARSQAAEDERLKAQMAEAETRIRALRDSAMSNVEGIAAETAQAIVEKLTGEKVSAQDISAAMSRGAA
jgi:F-type H+-transporting ATPase subunit b